MRPCLGGPCLQLEESYRLAFDIYGHFFPIGHRNSLCVFAGPIICNLQLPLSLHFARDDWSWYPGMVYGLLVFHCQRMSFATRVSKCCSLWLGTLASLPVGSQCCAPLQGPPPMRVCIPSCSSYHLMGTPARCANAYVMQWFVIPRQPPLCTLSQSWQW